MQELFSGEHLEHLEKHIQQFRLVKIINIESEHNRRLDDGTCDRQRNSLEVQLESLKN